MKDLVVFGANDLGRLLKFYIDKDDSRKIVAFTMDSDFIKEESFLGLPVVPFETLEKYYSPDRFDVLLAIGEHKMGNIRKNVFERCKKKG